MSKLNPFKLNSKIKEEIALMKRKRIVDKELLDTVKTLPCIACNSYPAEAHHLKTVGSGGDDTAENCIPTCRYHHRQFHDHGIPFMADNYPSVAHWLKAAGWTKEPRGDFFVYRHTAVDDGD